MTRMGFSVRVADARYTEWRVWKPTCEADWTDAGLVAQELYDHTGNTGIGAGSFDDFENANVAYQPHRDAQIKTLAAALNTQFNHGRPGC